MPRADFGEALRLERSILDSVARGMTDVGVGSGALLGGMDRWQSTLLIEGRILTT